MRLIHINKVSFGLEEIEMLKQNLLKEKLLKNLEKTANEAEQFASLLFEALKSTIMTSQELQEGLLTMLLTTFSLGIILTFGVEIPFNMRTG